MVRALLDRIGEPAEIVAAAPAEAAREPGAATKRPGAALEAWAVVMLTIGSFVPLIGWMLGVVLLWTSRRWRLSEKLLGTLVVPGGPGLVLLLLRVPTKVCTTGVPAPIVEQDGVLTPSPSAIETCTGFAFPPVVGVAVLLVIVVAPIVVAAVLLPRALSRAAAEPAAVTTVATRWGGQEVAAVLLLGPGTVLLPVIGAIVGLALVWSSREWIRTDKAVATALTVLPALIVSSAFLL